MTWMTLRGIGVHAKSGTGIYFTDGPIGVPNTFRNVGGNEVDSRNVQSNNHRRLAGNLHIVRVNLVSAINRGTTCAHVASELEPHKFIDCRYLFERPAVSFEHFHGL